MYVDVVRLHLLPFLTPGTKIMINSGWPHYKALQVYPDLSILS